MSTVIDRISQCRVLPILSVACMADVEMSAQVLLAHEMPAVEVTLRTPVGIDAIRRLRDLAPRMLIAAGTVLDGDQARQAQEAGADLAVSPGLNPATVHACAQLGLAHIPGVNDPSAVELALGLGLHTLKFFPAEASGGVPMLRALAGPFPEVKFIPTGGLGPANVADYLRQDNVIACGMTWIFDSSLMRRGDWQQVTDRARELLLLIRPR
jgi:2-dehydro-3-deoxyphosphogluconate aldolase/(4S)-4-hydroxy-2-oxoglutarate aldolase